MSVQINGTSGLVFNDGSTQSTGATGFGFKNRIINGAMMIDQRNAGASVAVTSSAPYLTDRFFGYKETSGATVTAQRSTVAPAGFVNSLGITISTGSNAGSTDQNIIQQGIEGFNVADLGWGTANAQPVTFSFWVRSSVTGTYGTHVSNNAANRCYVATYVINAANTWEYKTITIPGDTTGTWFTDNGLGIRVRFDLGSGSNFQITANTWGSTLGNTVSGRANLIGTTGATWYVTGVQLEKGSTATSFDYRPYGTELALCQRYFEITDTTTYSAESPFGTGVNPRSYWWFKVTKRAIPTVTNSGTSAVGTLYVPSVSGVGLFNSIGASTSFGHGATASAEL